MSTTGPATHPPKAPASVSATRVRTGATGCAASALPCCCCCCFPSLIVTFSLTHTPDYDHSTEHSPRAQGPGLSRRGRQGKGVQAVTKRSGTRSSRQRRVCLQGACRACGCRVLCVVCLVERENPIALFVTCLTCGHREREEGPLPITRMCRSRDTVIPCFCPPPPPASRCLLSRLLGHRF